MFLDQKIYIQLEYSMGYFHSIGLVCVDCFVSIDNKWNNIAYDEEMFDKYHQSSQSKLYRSS